MKRKNPYALPRGEFMMSISSSPDGVFLLTTKRVYMLTVAENDGKARSVFQALPIEPPLIREVKHHGR